MTLVEQQQKWHLSIASQKWAPFFARFYQALAALFVLAALSLLWFA